MKDEAAKDVTTLLAAAGQGDESAVARLAEVVHDELRRLAHAILQHERPHQTLRTTALVNEAWLRLAGGREVSYETAGTSSAPPREPCARS